MTPTSDSGPGPDKKAVRPAATIVLLRDGEAGPEVLMVQRARGAVFMADAYVFPGGRLDESDGGDYALAAAREAFEEAGVLLALDATGRYQRTDTGTEDAAWIEPTRAALVGGKERFADVLAAHGLRLASEDFVLFARWITPPTESRRFDANFFIARVPPGQLARPDAAEEVVSFRWDSPRAFLDEQLAGKLKLPPPTIWHLTDLAAHATVDAALAWARRCVVYPVRPKLTAIDGVVMILLPWDPAYATAPVGADEGEALAKDHPVARQAITRYELDDGRWVPKSL